MAKVVYCRDLGFDCDGIVRAETESEVRDQVAAHAKSVHRLESLPDGIAAQLPSLVREEK